MEKTLLRRKTVIENGIIINKIFVPKKVYVKHRALNTNTKVVEGWNIDNPSCNPPCSQATSTYFEECISGECVRYYY